MVIFTLDRVNKKLTQILLGVIPQIGHLVKIGKDRYRVVDVIWNLDTISVDVRVEEFYVVGG